MTTTSPTAPVRRDDALPAGKPPVGTGASPLVAQLIALALIGIGVVAVQHLLVQLGAVSGTSWLSSTVTAADGTRGGSALVLVVGIVAAALGALLLPVAVKPRPRRGVPLTAHTGVHLRPRDLGRVVSHALDDTDGVTDVDVRARRRRVRVVATTVVPQDRNAQVRAQLTTRAEAVLAPLERQPRITVKVRNAGV